MGLSRETLECFLIAQARISNGAVLPTLATPVSVRDRSAKHSMAGHMQRCDWLPARPKRQGDLFCGRCAPVEGCQNSFPCTVRPAFVPDVAQGWGGRFLWWVFVVLQASIDGPQPFLSGCPLHQSHRKPMSLANHVGRLQLRGHKTNPGVRSKMHLREISRPANAHDAAGASSRWRRVKCSCCQCRPATPVGVSWTC